MWGLNELLCARIVGASLYLCPLHNEHVPSCSSAAMGAAATLGTRVPACCTEHVNYMAPPVHMLIEIDVYIMTVTSFLCKYIGSKYCDLVSACMFNPAVSGNFI